MDSNDPRVADYLASMRRDALTYLIHSNCLARYEIVALEVSLREVHVAIAPSVQSVADSLRQLGNAIHSVTRAPSIPYSLYRIRTGQRIKSTCRCRRWESCFRCQMADRATREYNSL